MNGDGSTNSHGVGEEPRDVGGVGPELLLSASEVSKCRWEPRDIPEVCEWISSEYKERGQIETATSL